MLKNKYNDMIIDFDEANHVYAVNGNIADISVTALLRKHGLAPNYSSAPDKILQQSAEKGKEIHKDLENIINEKDWIPTTQQGLEFAEWVEKNIYCAKAEQKVAYEYNGTLIAATADLIGFTKDNEAFIADHKNTASFHREYVTWQVSLLDYMFRKLKGRKLNGVPFHWNGAKKFWCFHFNPTSGEMKQIELNKISDAEIERLIDCENKGEIYQRKELVLDSDLEISYLQAESEYQRLQKEFKRAEEQIKTMRAEILKLFEEQKISSWESKDKSILVSYIAPNEQVRVDSDKLKKEYPHVYSQCTKIVKTKASVRITQRNNEEGDNEDDK